jgi:hypothetical protein
MPPILSKRMKTNSRQTHTESAQSGPPRRLGRTSLSDAVYWEALRELLRHLGPGQPLRNRDIRMAVGLNYDQATKLSARATKEGVFLRRGHGGGTHYVLAALPRLRGLPPRSAAHCRCTD